MKNFILNILLQSNEQSFFRTSGKINIVIGIITIIFILIVAYLVRIDSRISEIEKKK